MFAEDRARAGELRERYPHAAEILGLYLALVEVWESVGDRVPAGDAVGWARSNVLPRVVAATTAHGPPALAAALATFPTGGRDTHGAHGAHDGHGAHGAHDGHDGHVLDAWLDGAEDLTPVERYLARATLRVVPPHDLRTAPPGPPARAAAPSGDGPAEMAPSGDGPADRVPAGDGPAGVAPGRCPECGGAPQLSYRAAADDPLVSGRRRLQCARCVHEWSFSSTTCPGCGGTGRRTVHAEPRAGRPQVGRSAAGEGTLFPHLRAESCESCRRYLIDVDLGRDPRAVPHVDELAAVPIDLHMADLGYTKITPNLMGF